MARSRNLAIQNSIGEYLAFIDADDIWKKNKLSHQFKFMKKKGSVFSFSSYDVVNEKKKILRKNQVTKDPDYRILLNSNFIGLSTVMIHNKIYSKISFPHLNTQEDFALWLKLLRNGIKLNHIKKSLSLWRKTKNSLSSKTVNKIYDAFKLYYIYENKNLLSAIFSVIILSYNKLKKKYSI